jgi:agmatinase
MGGEHTVALPICQAVNEVCSNVVVVHADAHADLRDEYEGSRINHATVIRRIVELIGSDRLIQLGIRSGTKEEFIWMRENGAILQWAPFSDKTLVDRIADRPVYLTLDLDVLDPACMPGTGNPEAGGWFYKDLERLLHAMNHVNLVAADVVELNPTLDPSESSAITAAKIVRELLLIV